LKVPAKQPARARLWLNDGSCVRLRPERVNHVWSYDFVQGHTYCPWSRRWRKFRVLVLIDEFSRECLALYVARTIKALDVIDVLSDLMLERGVPEFVRSDNGPEFVATILRNWLKSLGTNTAYITPGSPWENGYCESFNGKFRDECLAMNWFYSRAHAKVIIETWRKRYNAARPHSSLEYQTPLEFVSKWIPESTTGASVSK